MRRFICLLAGIAFGLILSQFPEYLQQYQQRLGGAVDELRAIAENFDATAQQAGLTRQAALARYSEAGDSFLNEQGRGMERTITRHERLTAQLAELQAAGPVERLMAFARYVDPEIGARALEVYRPAVPVTIEGLTYAALGLVLGYLALWLVLGLVTWPFRQRRSRYRHYEA